MSHADRGCEIGGKWCGASSHAADQLQARHATAITGRSWASIVVNARAGRYRVIMKHKARVPDVHTYLVLVCINRAMVPIPMVINTVEGGVLTVLDSLPED